eukprot:364114-Chlamydomonas_euryale.AAC.5
MACHGMWDHGISWGGTGWVGGGETICPCACQAAQTGLDRAPLSVGLAWASSSLHACVCASASPDRP